MFNRLIKTIITIITTTTTIIIIIIIITKSFPLSDFYFTKGKGNRYPALTRIISFQYLIKKSVLKCLSQSDTAQKMKFSIKDFFSKCDQIRSFLGIWSHLLKKSLMENFIFCAVWMIKFRNPRKILQERKVTECGVYLD